MNDYTKITIPTDLRDLRGKNVVVLVFAMPGCEHCEEFLPRFAPKAQPYINQGVPIFYYDLASEDASVQSIADRYEIMAAPTTLVLKRGNGSMKISGSYSNTDIDRLLAWVYTIHQGPVEPTAATPAPAAPVVLPTARARYRRQ
jgi:thiol-disulfide isomerase/thioredoxin